MVRLVSLVWWCGWCDGVEKRAKYVQKQLAASDRVVAQLEDRCCMLEKELCVLRMTNEAIERELESYLLCDTIDSST